MVSLVTLALLAGVLTTLLAGKQAGVVATPLVLAILGAVKIFQWKKATKT